MQFRYQVLPVLNLATALMFVSAAQAQEGLPSKSEWSTEASVSGFSDYVFRGLSQTLEDPAAQAEFVVGHENGFYAGTFISNIDFGDDADIEIDLFAGYSGGLGEAGYYDFSVLYYAYPGSDESYDYWEVMGELGAEFEFATLSSGLYYSWDNFLQTGDAWYPYVGIDIPLPTIADVEWSLNGEVGYQTIEDEVTYGLPDYWTWQAGLTFTRGIVEVDLRYHDTDVLNGASVDADAHFVGGVTLNFEF